MEQCIRKCNEETRIIDNCLSQAKFVGAKTMKSVLKGTNYARSLKAIPILAHAIENLKCEAFMGNTDITKYGESLSNIKRCFVKKDRNFSQDHI